MAGNPGGHPSARYAAGMAWAALVLRRALGRSGERVPEPQASLRAAAEAPAALDLPRLTALDRVLELYPPRASDGDYPYASPPHLGPTESALFPSHGSVVVTAGPRPYEHLHLPVAPVVMDYHRVPLDAWRHMRPEVILSAPVETTEAAVAERVAYMTREMDRAFREMVLRSYPPEAPKPAPGPLASPYWQKTWKDAS